VSVSKLRALVIQFLLPVLLSGLAAASFLYVAASTLPKPGAPLHKPLAPIATNFAVSGSNPLGMSLNSIGTNRDT